MIDIQPTPIDGLLLLSNPIFRDTRGSFKKIFSRDTFKNLSLEENFAELYYSINKKMSFEACTFRFLQRII
jgi:dTDP-4-dehydrorhamnose 3,5-epimerase-like enzyme